MLSAALQDEGWTTLFDAESGRAYYFNNKLPKRVVLGAAGGGAAEWKALGIQKSQLDAEPELRRSSTPRCPPALRGRDRGARRRLAGGRRTSKMGGRCAAA